MQVLKPNTLAGLCGLLVLLCAQHNPLAAAVSGLSLPAAIDELEGEGLTVL